MDLMLFLKRREQIFMRYDINGKDHIQTTFLAW